VKMERVRLVDSRPNVGLPPQPDSTNRWDIDSPELEIAFLTREVGSGEI